MNKKIYSNMTRTSPNFSDIQNTQVTEEGLQLKLNQNIEKWKAKKSGESDTEIDKIKPKRKENSTSQNHIISDHYIQIELKDVCEKVKKLLTSKDNENHIGLFYKNKIHKYLDNIFSKNEQQKLQIAKSKLDMYFNNNCKITDFCQFVASNGSANAIEGNSSANSGIGKNMDAPRKSSGELISPCKKAKDNHLFLSNINFQLTPNVNKKKEAIKFTLNAISPNLVGNGVRVSSRPILDKTERLKRSKSFHKTNVVKEQNPQITSKKKLTSAQKRHLEQGYIVKRKISII